MNTDVLRAVEMITSYTNLTEQTARALPVWDFFDTQEEAERRYEKQKAKK